MRTLDLLAVGRSFAGMRGKPARLRLEPDALPRFGRQASSPFRSPAPDGQATASGPSSPSRRAAPAAKGFSDAPKTRLASPSQTTATSSAGPDAGWNSARLPRPGVGWLRKLRRIFHRRQVAARPLVQGELSLDTIQVVRNDLSDADVEVVTPARAVVGRMRHQAPPPKDPVVAVSRWRSWLGAWTRMSD